VPACCAKVNLKQNCHRCRCLEQLQVVTLTNGSWDQNSVRVLPAVALGNEASVDSPANNSIQILSTEGPPGNLGFLTTCTLRC
jgi:hypothetical protein